jgi:hypothetical protein
MNINILGLRRTRSKDSENMTFERGDIHSFWSQLDERRPDVILHGFRGISDRVLLKKL